MLDLKTDGVIFVVRYKAVGQSMVCYSWSKRCTNLNRAHCFPRSTLSPSSNTTTLHASLPKGCFSTVSDQVHLACIGSIIHCAHGAYLTEIRSTFPSAGSPSMRITYSNAGYNCHLPGSHVATSHTNSNGAGAIFGHPRLGEGDDYLKDPDPWPWFEKLHDLFAAHRRGSLGLTGTTFVTVTEPSRIAAADQPSYTSNMV
jgi:hypothetical protein